MASVTAFEAKTRFGQLLERVAAGEEVVITRHDKPVARIVPEGRPSIGQVGATVAAMGVLRERIARRSRSGARLTDAAVRRAIDLGRR